MGNYDFNGESPVNYDQKTLACLVLDNSGSMRGSPIREVNEGLKNMRDDIMSDPTANQRVEIAVITFNSQVKVICEPIAVEQFNPDKIKANGSTKLVDGVRESFDIIEQRKNWYTQTGQQYTRPYIILVTDGMPDSDQNISQLAREISNGVDSKRFAFWPFGTQSADFETLKEISHPEFPPVRFNESNFNGFFELLSTSLCAISSSREGELIQIGKPENFQIVV